MKLEIKKIIAREFLILTLVLIFGLIIFLCVYPYNAFLQSQIEKRTTQIFEKRKLADSLSRNYKTKLNNQTWFFAKFQNYYDLTADKTFDERDEIWKKFDNWALKDSINYRWEHRWGRENITFLKSIGFSNSQSLQSFIERNRISKVDSVNFNSSLVINSESAMLSKSKKVKESKVVSSNEQTAIAKKTLIFCFILFFGLRYFFYSLKWSLNVLKQ